MVGPSNITMKVLGVDNNKLEFHKYSVSKSHSIYVKLITRKFRMSCNFRLQDIYATLIIYCIKKCGGKMIMNEKAKVINLIGWINIVGGIIGSFMIGSIYPETIVSNYSSYVDKEYNWALVVAGIIISIVSGVLLFGFAEIINLLQEKVNQSKQIEKLLITINNNVVNDDVNKDNAAENELPSL